MIKEPLLQFAGIIPARYASSRFPGKPLVLIGNKPMIQRVYEQASKALGMVYVATDDKRIFEAVVAFGGKAIMTSPDHMSLSLIHISEPTRRTPISYAVFCLKK